MATSFPFSRLWLLPPEPGRATAKERKARATDDAPGGAEGPAPERRAGAAGGWASFEVVRRDPGDLAKSDPAPRGRLPSAATTRYTGMRTTCALTPSAHTRAGPRTCSHPPRLRIAPACLPLRGDWVRLPAGGARPGPGLVPSQDEEASLGRARPGWGVRRGQEGTSGVTPAAHLRPPRPAPRTGLRAAY